MSELTKCNYCDLQAIKRSAKEKGLAVTTTASGAGMGGINVYVHPADVSILRLSPKGRENYFKVWFMSLSDHCVC